MPRGVYDRHRLKRKSRKVVCMKCEPPRAFKRQQDLNLHAMQAHEGRKWSRVKGAKRGAFTAEADRREPVAIQHVTDLKYCPDCAANLTVYARAGVVEWCPACGFNLALFARTARFLTAAESLRTLKGRLETPL